MKRQDSNADAHAEIAAFLGRPGNWPDNWRGHRRDGGSDAGERVDVVETHGARVFLCGETALKVRRAIRLPYLDFSTLERRRRFAEREMEINRAFAPDIYQGVVAITRDKGGDLAIGGDGGDREVVEWAVRMRRFGQDQLLSHLADCHGI